MINNRIGRLGFRLSEIQSPVGLSGFPGAGLSVGRWILAPTAALGIQKLSKYVFTIDPDNSRFHQMVSTETPHLFYIHDEGPARRN